ncbi:DUF2809 domain-containing protein [Rhizobium leucaenae]|jgi:hypothetical protein|uniref:ribosomal maturation YjgA family protein n=1 Tax=Rhizobium leucaenae TaxID=29450 RepID=UPI001560A890|nr:DUF2809 domain-containing protein [Rhizobium leucaenae]
MQPKLTRRRIGVCLALVLTIVCGLALRRFGYAAHLSFQIVKYGGSILWGAMVYWLLATVFAGARRMTLTMALIVAVLVELFRLWHTPALDAFRLTTAGALLLGRVFSPWNMLAYATGIAMALALDWSLSSRKRLA